MPTIAPTSHAASAARPRPHRLAAFAARALLVVLAISTVLAVVAGTAEAASIIVSLAWAGAQPATTGAPRSEPTIAAVQGAGHTSPFAGRRVSLRAIATVVDTDAKRPGFWIQSIEEDGDPATAEGLRIDTRGVPALAPGDLVAVDGTVTEGPDRPGELRVTRLTDVSWRVVERGRALPPPVRIVAAAIGDRVAATGDRRAAAGDGAAAKGATSGAALAPPSAHIDDDGLSRFEPTLDAIDFFESLEGMRVAIARPVVVGPTTNFREFVVLADAGAGSVLRSWRGGLVARPGDDDPERILVDPRLLEEMERVIVGDSFEGALIGVLDYAFGSYRLMLTEAPPPILRREAPPDQTLLRGDADHLTVAAWNVFDLGGDDGDGVFRSIARSLVEDLGAPDLVALAEIADASGDRDDGRVDGAPTLSRLVAAVSAAGGPLYGYRQIDPRNNEDGGAPGANIRVALLFAPSRVAFVDRGRGDAVTPTAVTRSLVNAGATGGAIGSTTGGVTGGATGGGPTLTLSPGRVEPGDVAWRESRKPLAAELRFAQRPLFVVANHFSSKLEDNPPFGSVQPPVRWSEPRRRAQAAVVARHVRDLLDADPGAAVLVLGDLNEHWFGEPLEPLIAAGLEPLVTRVPLAERYTYNHRGLSQVLDHVLVSPGLAAGAEIDLVHTNADFPAWRRSSDHDAVVVKLRLR